MSPVLNETSIEIKIPEGVQELKIPEQKNLYGLPFPLVLRPSETHQSLSEADWEKWIVSNRKQLEDLLAQHGAILFRGFPLENPTDFDNFAKAYGWQPYEYLGGLAPRNHVVGNVFTSTEVPAKYDVLYHHELGHTLLYPKLGYKIEWKENGRARMMSDGVMSISREHERTRRRSWFNIILSGGRIVSDLVTGEGSCVTTAEGQCISDDVMNDVFKVADEVGVACPWKKGDIMMIDNLQVLHSRKPFKPPRQVLASLYTY